MYPLNDEDEDEDEDEDGVGDALQRKTYSRHPTTFSPLKRNVEIRRNQQSSNFRSLHFSCDIPGRPVNELSIRSMNDNMQSGRELQTTLHPFVRNE